MIGSSGDAVFVPIIPSFDKFFSETEKASSQAGKSAGEKFAQEMERSTAKAQKAVDSAAKAQERAQNRAADAADKTRIAQLKLNEVLEKGTATQSQIAKATADYEKAQRDEASAVKAAEKAARNHTQAQDQLKKVSDEAANSVKLGADANTKFGASAAGASESSKGFEVSLGKVAAAAAAGVAALGAAGKALYDIGATFDDAFDTIRIGTGASGDAFEGLKDSMRNVAQNSIGVGSDLGEIGTTLADLNTRLGVTGEPLEKLTTQFQQLKGMGMEADINAVTGAFTQFGIAGEQAPAAMDSLFQISQATGRSIDEMVTNLSKSGPALQQFGFDLTESAGLLGALDKAGLDADKTMMSMTKALGQFAKEGKDPQEALWGTIQKIDELTKAGKGMEAVDLANSIFGAKGGAGFVAAVESGQFAYDDFMSSIGASSDTISGVAAETADFAEKWDQFKLRAMLAIEPVASAVFDAMVPALETAWQVTEKVIEKFQELGDWVQKNTDWLAPLGVSLGIVAGGLAAIALQQKIVAAGGMLKWLTDVTKATVLWESVTKAAAAAQQFLNAAMKNNVFGLVITAIAALIAGLTVFFTKTETGREMWAKFTDFLKSSLSGVAEFFQSTIATIRTALEPFAQKARETITTLSTIAKSAWDTLAAGVQAAWTTIIHPVFMALEQVARALVVVIVSVVVGPIIAAWKLMSAAIQVAWTSIIKPTWDALSAAALWLWNTVLQPTFTAISTAFSALGTAIQTVWQNVIKPAWDALAAAAQALWANYLQPAFTAIGNGFALLGQTIQTVWTNVIKPVWDALASAATWLWNTVLQPTFTFILNGFTVLGTGLMNVWTAIIQPAFQAVAAGATWLWQNVLQPTFTAIRVGFENVGHGFQWVWENIIRPAWDALGTNIRWVVDNVVDPAFAAVRSGLDTLANWFDKTVSAIGRIWDRMKEVTAAPIRFVVNTVWNDGLLKAVNAVVGFIGMEKLSPVPLKFARGGVMPGPSTPGRDIHRFYSRTGGVLDLSGREAVMRPEFTDVVGPDWVDAVNAAARMGGRRGVANLLSGMQHQAFAKGGVVPYLGKFAGGGVVESISAAVRKNFPMMTITSTYRPGDPGWHGRGKAVDFSNGTDTTPQMQSAARWFHANYGPGLIELIHWPLNGWQNIKHGKPLMYSASTNAGHRNHVHVAAPGPLADPKVMVEMLAGGGGGGGVFPSMREIVGKAFKAISDPMIKVIPEFAGYVGKIPRAVATWGRDKLLEFVTKKADTYAPAGGAAGNAESWREMAMAAMRRNGFNADDPRQVNAMLKQIMSESSANPNAVQGIVDINGTGESAGVGLLQIVPGTFADHRDPTLPNDRRDPWANMNAALRYYKWRYGNDLTTMWGHGHGYKNGGVLPGYTPGRDIHRFWSPTGGIIDLSGGESIMVPEWTAMQGGPAAIKRMNREARAGRRTGVRGPNRFADGGVWARNSDPMRDLRFAADSLQLAAKEINVAFHGGDFGYGALAAVLRNEQWAKSIVQGAAQLGKIADPNTLQGIAARSFANEMTGIFGSLGMANTAEVTGTLIAAEKGLADARNGHVERLRDIREKEDALEDARAALAEFETDNTKMSIKDARKLADAEKAVADAKAEAGNDQAKTAAKVAKAEEKLRRVREDLGVKDEENAAKRAEEQVKAAEEVEKAEAALLESRRKSAAALDVTIFELAPQITTMASSAAAATAAFPPVSQALWGVAAATGPAGVSLGEVVAGIKSMIQVGKMAYEMVQKIISGVKQAKVEVHQGLSSTMGAIKDLNAMYQKQREQVAGLVITWNKAMLDMQAAARNVRITQMDGVIAQLKGAKEVAVAQANLNKHMRDGRKTLDDNRSAWRGFYTELQYGTKEAGKQVVETWAQAGAYVGVTQEQIADSIAQSQEEYLAWMREREALEIEIAGAQAQQRVLELQAQAANLEAAYKYSSAVLAMDEVTRQLESAARNLAIMAGKAFGFDQAGAMVGQKISELLAEKASIEAEQSANRLKVFSWHASGANKVANSRKSQIDTELQRLYAMPEWTGWSADQQASIDQVMSQAKRLGGLGGSASIERLIKTSALGDPSRELADIQLRTELQGIKDQQAAMNEQLRKAALDAAYQIQSEPLSIKIKAAEMDKAVFDARAEAARSDSEIVRSALDELAKAYEKNANEMRGIAQANPREIVLNVPHGKTAWTTAEMRDLTDEFNRQVDGLKMRLSDVERQGSVRAADVALSRR